MSLFSSPVFFLFATLIVDWRHDLIKLWGKGQLATPLTRRARGSICCIVGAAADDGVHWRRHRGLPCWWVDLQIALLTFYWKILKHRPDEGGKVQFQSRNVSICSRRHTSEHGPAVRDSSLHEEGARLVQAAAHHIRHLRHVPVHAARRRQTGASLT